MSRARTQTRGEHSGLLRRYPPLATVVLALLLAVSALPSALNLPQANPGQTLEYAPVSGSGNAPPGGNLAALGLGASSTGPGGSGGLAGGPLGQPGPLQGAGGQPSSKRCVGNPPRQTEDPLSPPCVAYFAGDNGGATYQGVSAREIRVVYYFDGADAAGTSNGDDKHPPDSYYDLAAPASSGDPVFVHLLRDLQTYFNDRYQTYGRAVHIIVHFGAATPTEATRGADAAQDIQRFDPFAVVAAAPAYLDSYVRPMIAHGVLVFLGNPAAGVFGSSMEPSAYYSAHPGLIWSYFPSIEQLAKMTTSYVCSKVLPNPVSFSGNSADQGPRHLGLWASSAPSRPDLVQFSALVRQGVEACGGTFAEAFATSSANGSGDSSCSDVAAPWAQFKQSRVTTVIWTAGYTGYCEATFAQGAQYSPELLVAGEGLLDTNLTPTVSGPSSFWSHARAVSTYTAVETVATEPCVAAFREVDPSIPSIDAKGYGCLFYPDLRELFTGIQAAGPRLDPRNMDQGYHAIPAHASADPSVPACFYPTGDYSCVKDAQEEWWDPSGVADTSSQPGCWRMMESGKRYLPGSWPPDNVDAERRQPGDPCNFVGIAVA